MKATGSILRTNTSLPQTSYLLHSCILELLGNLLRIALWLMIAGCGPRIQPFAFLAAGAAAAES
jgi:hypothetical protein